MAFRCTAGFAAVMFWIGSSMVFAEVPHVVVLADLHLPGRQLACKRAVLDRIEGWPGVGLVAVLGDLCETTGTAQEYATVADFFSGVELPLAPVVGNHDYVYTCNPAGRTWQLADSSERLQKLQRFRDVFELQQISYEVKLGRYRLIFLSLDSLDSHFYASIAPDTLRWLDERLAAAKPHPTIVFCHAPLWDRRVLALNPMLAHFLTQPQEELEEIVLRHHHLIAWVAGHVHMGPHNEVAASPLNLFGGRIPNILVPDMDGRSILQGHDIQLEQHDGLWTTSLFLYDDHLLVRTFDHRVEEWLPELDRSIVVP